MKKICIETHLSEYHDDVIKWKHFPRRWPYVRGIHRSAVNSPHKSQWRGAFYVFFDLHLDKQLSKQSQRWWFETQSCSLWRPCNVCHSLHRNNNSDVNSMFYFRVTTEALACIEVALEGCTEQELINMGMYDTYTKLQEMVVDYGCWWNKLVLIYHVLRVLLQIKFLLMNMAELIEAEWHI